MAARLKTAAAISRWDMLCLEGLSEKSFWEIGRGKLAKHLYGRGVVCERRFNGGIKSSEISANAVFFDLSEPPNATAWIAFLNDTTVGVIRFVDKDGVAAGDLY